MIKLQFLIRPVPPSPIAEFARAVRETLAPALLAREPRQLSLIYTAELPPRLTVIPFRRTPICVVTLDGDESDPAAWVEAMSRALPGGQIAGYRVEQAVPVAYARDWADGRDTPGVGLLTLMRKPPALDRDRFIRQWHGHHTPLSLEVHPLWSYLRGVVEAPLLSGSPPLDGIVEEHFRTRRDLFNPMRFFGGPLWMLPNMIRVGLDVRGFIDLRTIENYLVAERHLRS
jgi:hypothetical protein